MPVQEWRSLRRPPSCVASLSFKQISRMAGVLQLRRTGPHS